MNSKVYSDLIFPLAFHKTFAGMGKGEIIKFYKY